MDEYDAFIARLKGAASFLVASHYNPDGDAIGSTIALGLLLKRLGKDVLLYNRDPIPKSLGFLPGAEGVVHRIPQGMAFDLAIMVDCAQRERVSDEFAAHAGFKAVACIDHHLHETPDAGVTLVDSAAAATGVVIARLMKRAGVGLDTASAQCIYTTLVVDTGFFKYSGTDAEVLSLAAELVRAGASPWTVAKGLEESHPFARMRLLSASLATLAVEEGGRYATMDVTRGALLSSGAAMEMSDEFAVFPRSIEGVEVAALFREADDGRIKVSMRSKDVVDVSAIARNFGGGGHARAAGFYVRGTLADVKAKVLGAVRDALGHLSIQP